MQQLLPAHKHMCSERERTGGILLKLKNFQLFEFHVCVFCFRFQTICAADALCILALLRTLTLCGVLSYAQKL